MRTALGAVPASTVSSALGGGRHGERPKSLRGRDRPLDPPAQAAPQDGQGVHAALAHQPPERRLELAGRDRRERGLERLVGGLAADEGLQGSPYHWVSRRSTGWRAGGESIGRK